MFWRGPARCNFLPRFNLCRPPIVDHFVLAFVFLGRVSVDNRILKLRFFSLVQQIFFRPCFKSNRFFLCLQFLIYFLAFCTVLIFVFMAACFAFCIFCPLLWLWWVVPRRREVLRCKESNLYSSLRASRVLNETAHRKRDEIRRVSRLSNSEKSSSRGTWVHNLYFCVALNGVSFVVIAVRLTANSTVLVLTVFFLALTRVVTPILLQMLKFFLSCYFLWLRHFTRRHFTRNICF